MNSGSSSLKFGLYRVESFVPKMLLSGEAESIGGREGKFWVKDGNDNLLASESADFRTQQDAVTRIGRFLADCGEIQPIAIGHRVVHGGPNLRHHCLIDDAVLRQLEAATAFAPAARSVPELFAAFTQARDASTIGRIQDDIGQAIAQLDAIAAEAKHERISFLAAEPNLGPLLRTLLRLRHDLVMIGRAAAVPLPETFQHRLGPPLARVAETAADYLRRSGEALAAGRAPPPLGAAEAALDGCDFQVWENRRHFQVRAKAWCDARTSVRNRRRAVFKREGQGLGYSPRNLRPDACEETNGVGQSYQREPGRRP